jgi:microcystin-dependent protein
MFIGNIIAYTGLSVPSGYLVCDGSAVGREEYPELFAVIGTTYGAGDGLTTFNIPNLLGKAGLGSSQNHVVGSSGGEEAHLLDSAETPSHLHTIPQHTHNLGLTVSLAGLSHTVTQPVFTYVGLKTTTSPVTSSSAKKYSGRTTGTMSQSTNLEIADHPATACTVTGGILDCPAFNTENAGSGLGHNNMMPYLAVTYIIKSGLPVPLKPGMAMYNGFMVATAGGGYISGKTV